MVRARHCFVLFAIMFFAALSKSDAGIAVRYRYDGRLLDTTMQSDPDTMWVQCDACEQMRCDAMRCGAMRCDAMRCDADADADADAFIYVEPTLMFNAFICIYLTVLETVVLDIG